MPGYQPLIAVSIFTLAFALRVIFGVQWQDMPYGSAPLLDARVYDDWARSIAQGHGTGGSVFYQSPLYPYLLAGIYRLAGYNYLAASFLNALLDSTTCVILSLIAYTVFGRLAAIATGILAATYAPMIFYTASTMKEPLVLFMMGLFLLTALKATRKNSCAEYLLCGVTLGFVILGRGNALLLAPIVPVSAYLRHRRAASRGIGAFLFAILIPIVPVAYHNIQVSHDFVPITYADGFNLYIGHSPYANGTNAYPPEASTDPEQERLDTTWVAEKAAGHPLKPSEISAFWRAKALNYARSHPLREFQLIALKIFAFWNDSQSFDNYDVKFIKKNFPSLLDAPLTEFWLIALLFAFALCGGCWRLRPNRRADFLIVMACVVFYMGSVLIFYVTDRYRLPIVVFIMPVAGAAISCAQRLIWHREKRQLAIATAVSFLSLFLTLHAPLSPTDLTAFDWGTLTTIYANKQQMSFALDAFQRGENASPGGMGSQAYCSMASIYEDLDQTVAARQLLEAATKIFPEDGVVLYNLGRTQALHGELDEALASMLKAKTFAPTYMLTYFALAKIYEKKGDMPEAKEALREGLGISPQDPHLVDQMHEWQDQ